MEAVGILTTSNIQTWLEGRIQLLQSMSQQISQDGSSDGALRHSIGLQAYAANFIVSYFGGQDGVMFSIPEAKRPADYDPRARGWYKAAAAAQQTVVTEPYVAASSGKLVFIIASPVQRNGTLLGVAGADLDLTSVSNIINSVNFRGHGACLHRQCRRQDSHPPRCYAQSQKAE